MSKNIKTENKVNMEEEVMSKVTSGKIIMRPRWYFIVGSVFSIIGLVALSVMSVFLVNVVMFSLRQHGPMGQIRLEEMFTSFPLWVPFLALFGIITGIFLLRRYDFSYKTSFFLIVVGFIASIIIAGLIIDNTGLNDSWSQKGVMRQFYQGVGRQENIIPNGSGKGMMQGQRGNGRGGNR